MPRKALLPDVISFSAGISACEKSGNWQQALQLLSDMQADGVQADVICINAGISACEKAGQWQMALHIFSETQARKEHGFVPVCPAASCSLPFLKFPINFPAA